MKTRKLTPEERAICSAQIENLTEDIEQGKYDLKILKLYLDEGLKWEFRLKRQATLQKKNQTEANIKNAEERIKIMQGHLDKGVPAKEEQ